MAPVIYGDIMDNGIRINKFLSESGVCSRREADRLIESGRVLVNGIPAVCGMKITQSDKVAVNGKVIQGSVKPVLLLYNKPLGIVCSTAEKDNIIDYINYPERIYPVGRLDKNSTGLIFLTNQGDIHDTLLRAANNHEKEYYVKVNKPINDEMINGMKRGVPILNTVTKPCKIKIISDREFNIVLTQGLNRQIRRMCDYYDYRVVALNRIRIMDYRIGNLKQGHYITFDEEMIKQFKNKLGL